MKNIFLGFILLFAMGCSKDEECNLTDVNTIAPASETTNVQTYLTTNNITGTTLHSSGFYYKITQAGSGKAIINLCSAITIKYVGKFTNGTIFDQPTPVGSSTTFTLGELIVGWQKGLPLISSGGKTTLYIPPSLGYGSNDVKDNTGKVVIPANSILIFDIELVAVS